MLRDKYFVINACGDKHYRALAHLSAERFIYIHLFPISVIQLFNYSIIQLFIYYLYYKIIFLPFLYQYISIIQ